MSEEKLNNIIEHSGNTFQFKVVEKLRFLGWEVLVSPYYLDNVSDKPREIDIIAEKEFKVSGVGGIGYKGTINIKLFIECKYINTENIFWFDNKDREKAIQRIKNDININENNSLYFNNLHHYLSEEKVAKLFSSSGEKGQENEIFYKAINQSLNAFIYYRGNETILKKHPNARKYILRKINYPIIICQNFNNLFSAGSDGEDPKKIEDNFQIEINYINHQTNTPEYFLIDVVDFDKIEDFLNKIQKNDVDNIIRFLVTSDKN